MKKLLENLIINPFDIDYFTAATNKTIAFDEEILKSVKNISNLGNNKKNSSDTFGINGLLKQKYQSLKQFRKTISDFQDIWSMAIVETLKTQSWH